MAELLPLPPGFKGFDPHKHLRIYTRHLPHWRQDGATYFVTFRMGDSLPESKIDELKTLRAHWEYTHPQPWTDEAWRGYAREVMRRSEVWLDEGHGVCYFQQQRWIKDMNDRLQYFNGVRYQLSCSVIMPNHCHVVIRPYDGYELEDLLGAMKGVNARNINAAIGKQGEIWEQECYDRIIRDGEHLYRVIQYIGRNPAASAKPKEKWPRWIEPGWVQAGWGFES